MNLLVIREAISKDVVYLMTKLRYHLGLLLIPLRPVASGLTAKSAS